jgi:hypothetical protein
MFEIAYRSHVGIYHHVPEKDATKDLTESFGASLAIFRTMSMLDVKVTLSPIKETEKIVIGRPDAGSYSAARNDNGSWTIAFGDLARNEN